MAITSSELHNELIAASSRSRASLLYFIFDEVQKGMGRDAAIKVLATAHERLGASAADFEKNTKSVPRTAVFEAFVSSHPPEFQAQTSSEGPATIIDFIRCPYLSAWKAARLDDKTIEALSFICVTRDRRYFESHGFRCQAECWTPGIEGCCKLKIFPPP